MATSSHSLLERVPSGIFFSLCCCPRFKQLPGALRRLFVCLLCVFFCVAGMFLHLDIRCTLSSSFYFRSTRDRHIQTEGMILILRVSPLRVAMRLPVSILIMSSSHACSSKSITIPTYSNSLVKCSWPKVPLGWSTKIQCAAQNSLAVGHTSPGHIRSYQDFNPGIS